MIARSRDSPICLHTILNVTLLSETIGLNAMKLEVGACLSVFFGLEVFGRTRELLKEFSRSI